ELSSSILLFTAPTTVIATAIFDLYQLPSWEGVAALSTILLVLNGVVIAAGNWALGGRLLGRPGGSGARSQCRWPGRLRSSPAAGAASAAPPPWPSPATTRAWWWPT